VVAATIIIFEVYVSDSVVLEVNSLSNQPKLVEYPLRIQNHCPLNILEIRVID
jgi:hypothetical protein